MGNLIQEELKTDAPEIMGELGETATWNGNDYDCVIEDPDVTSELETGGFALSGLLTVKILRADFNDAAGPFPQDNDRITYNGRVYHAISTTNRTDSAYIRLVITP